jgi:SPP1 gp7 family putative phage head morphogenesis protein
MTDNIYSAPIDDSWDSPSGFGSGIVLNFATGGGMLDVALDAFTELLFNADEAATHAMVEGFDTAHAGYEKRITSLMDDLVEYPDQPGKVFQLERFKKLDADLKASAQKYGQFAEHTIYKGQAAAAHIANEMAEQTVVAAAIDEGLLPSVANWAKFPDRAFTDMVGRLHDGSPLNSLLNTFGKSASDAMKQALINGVAQGLNTDVLGAKMAKSIGITRHRAVAISRTSILSSYREGARRSFAANSRIIRGWVWQSSRDKRTCMACIARDGTVYPLNVRMPAHVSCRCRMRPVLRHGQNVRNGTGTDWFREQPPNIQSDMLGPHAYEKWKKGEFDIPDLAGYTVDPKWGASSSRRSLKDMDEFIKGGRKYHPADVPPGLLTTEGMHYLPGDVEVLLNDLKAAKIVENNLANAPDWVDDFVDCMGPD